MKFSFESSSLVPVLFREVFSHPYISFFHLLVNVFFVICITGPVVSGGANVSIRGVAIQGKLRSQYQV